MSMRQGTLQKFIPVALIVFLAVSAGIGPAARLETRGWAAERTVDVLSLLRAFGIGFVVDRLGPELNQLINALTLRHTAASQQATKVVPIVSAGTGAYVGAAQVTGPREQVDKVRAVAQIEADFFAGSVRAKALVPLDALNPLNGIRRVQGVGILAVIDINVESTVPTSREDADEGGSSGPDHPPVSEPPGFAFAEHPALRYLLFAEEDVRIRGNHNTFSGDVYAGDEIRISGNKNSVRGERERDQSGYRLPDFSRSDWRRWADHRYEGDTTFDDVTLRGVYYVAGDATLRGAIRGEAVIVVEGALRVDSRSVAGDLVFLVEEDITLRRSNATVRAVWIATDGEIEIAGNNLEFEGVLAGREVQIDGNNNYFTYAPIVAPSRTPRR